MDPPLSRKEGDCGRNPLNEAHLGSHLWGPIPVLARCFLLLAYDGHVGKPDLSEPFLERCKVFAKALPQSIQDGAHRVNRESRSFRIRRLL